MQIFHDSPGDRDTVAGRGSPTQLIEYTKEVQEAFEASLSLDMGQILSIPFVILGTYCMIRAKKKVVNS